jgi:purine-binding chemotaxis protein CheW
MKFGMSKTEETVNTCIIIVEVNRDDELLVIGTLADSVHEVFEFENAQIEPPPRIGTILDTEFIRGMGKRGEEFIIILDIDRILTQQELSDIQTPDQGTPKNSAKDDIPEKGDA